MEQTAAAAGACPPPAAAAHGSSDHHQELQHLQQQYQLAQEEVFVLQAQVGRLSSAAAVGEAAAGSSHLQQRLDAALLEVQQTRALLQQQQLEADAAVQAAYEQRSGALRLLLADFIKQASTAQQLAADKAEDCEAMRAALAAANAHILLLTAQQEPPPNDDHQHSHAVPALSAADTAGHAAEQPPGSPPEDAALLELQQQMGVQRQQLECAQEQIKTLVQQLSLKRDCADFAERRATMLERQLAAARQEAADALATAAAAAAAANAQLCAGSVAEAEPRHDLGLVGDSPVQQQQQSNPQLPHQSKTVGLAGTLSAALSNAATGLSLKASGREDADNQQPLRQQVSPPPLSPPRPFALARNFVAGREAEAVVRLKDELHTCQQEAAALSAANSRYETQIAGLQTVLVTKVALCNRLDKETKELSKSLRAAEAAAAADRSTLGQQLSQLSERLLVLQEALEASQQREQQLESQLAATRAKLAEVLDTLVNDAATLQQHKPAQHKLMAQHMPALLADVLGMATSSATHSSSSSLAVHNGASDDDHSLPAARAASVPASGSNVSVSSGQQLGPSSAASQAAPLPGDGTRSVLRSRTLSSVGGGGAGAGRVLTGPGSVAPAGKQSAAAKLLYALRIGNLKGSSREQDARKDDAGLPPAGGHAGRTTGSGEYSYELLDS